MNCTAAGMSPLGKAVLLSEPVVGKVIIKAD